MNYPIDKIIKMISLADYVYIAGNGGSASTANHFANDLVKMCGIKAISLCSNEAVVMSYANDDGYENIFSEQLKVFMKRLDLLVTISGSGTSKNIIKAIETTNDLKGNYLRFPTMTEMDMNMQEIEDYHLQLVHKIAKELSK